LDRENHLPLPVLTPLVHPQPQDPPQTGRDPGPTRHIVSAIMFVPRVSTPNPGIYTLLNREKFARRTTLPLPVLTLLVHPQPQDLPQSGRDPGPTRHIMSAIMFVPPFSTLKLGIFWMRGTVEHVAQGEPPSLYLFWFC